MARFRRSRVPIGIAAVCALLIAGAPASATPPRPPMSPCLNPATQDLLDEGALLKTSNTTYRTTTTQSYWSVVAVLGHGYTPNLDLFDVSRCPLESAYWNGDGIDVKWIAFDNNVGRLPTGVYATMVSKYPTETSPVNYHVQFVAGDKSLSTTTTASQPVGTDYADWMVDIRDVFLNAGQRYDITVTGGVRCMHVLGTTYDNPDDWAVEHYEDHGGESICWPGASYTSRTGTLIVVPEHSGWYGVLFDRMDVWGAPVSVKIHSW